MLKNEIKELCKKNLAVYSVPKEFEFRKSLPKTLLGKIDVNKLNDGEEEDIVIPITGDKIHLNIIMSANCRK